MEQKDKRLMAYSYFGGKNGHLNFLLPLLKCVEPKSFLEVFLGSGAVSLNMDAPVMTMNDLNGSITNFFMVLREFPDQLIHKLNLTPYSRTEYLNAWDNKELDCIERARNFYVRAMQGFGGCGALKVYNSWAVSIGDSRWQMSSKVSSWLKGVDGLYAVAQKLRTMQIENRNYSEVIRAHSRTGTLIYADPPYPMDSRAGHIKYAFEFDDAEHVRLASLLHDNESFVAVSGYRCDLMDELYKDFYRSVDKPKRTNNPKARREEVLWTNYNPREFIKAAGDIKVK